MKDLVKSLEQMGELVERIEQRKTELETATAKELSDYISSEIDIEGLLRHIMNIDMEEWKPNRDQKYCNLLYTVGMGHLNYVCIESAEYGEGGNTIIRLDREKIRLFLNGIDFERGKHG